MSFKIKTIHDFERELKRLAKKYPSIKKDYTDFIDSIEENPLQGTPLGKNCYKIRMAISSKTQGKSGGARIITCIKIVQETVFLVAIYDKSDIENISDAEIERRLKNLN